MSAQRKPQPDPLASADGLVPSPAKDLDLVEEKHRQIVEGACRLFFAKGFHRTTIREIALSCGMSMGQLYHYISGKDDVLFLVYRHMQMLWFDYLQKSGVEEISDPLTRLRESLGHTLRFMTENKDLFLFIYTETKYLEKTHLKVVLEMDDQNVVGFWRRILNQTGLKQSDPDQLDFLANLVSYLMVFLVLRGWNLKKASSEKNLERLCDFILMGLDLEVENV